MIVAGRRVFAGPELHGNLPAGWDVLGVTAARRRWGMAMRTSGIGLLLGSVAALICSCAGSDGDWGTAAGASVTPGSSTGASAGPAANAAASAVTTAGTVSAEPSRSGAACATQLWGTEAKIGSPVMTAAPLYLVRVGQHPCYDRVVFDVNGVDAVGYAVRYVPLLRADGSGKPVPVAGNAALEVVVGAPVLGTDSQGH